MLITSVANLPTILRPDAIAATTLVPNQPLLPSQDKAALLDLRIGLHLLGEEGCLLLAHYLRMKSQQGL